MAGHSKWNNIKRKKEKADAQRGKVFTKIAREITVAVREGGPDPEMNSQLRDAISKAKTLNVPNDNIERAIKRASDADQNEYEELIYEGYGPGGVAVIVSTLTDNRNRTAGEMRHYFSKNSGNLGQAGSVMFQFQQLGIIVIENTGFDEETIMEHALDAGADDYEYSEEAIEITTQPAQLPSVRNALEQAGYTFASAELEYVPTTEVELDGAGQELMEKLIEMLEDNDDVQDVWHNWEEPDDE